MLVTHDTNITTMIIIVNIDSVHKLRHIITYIDIEFQMLVVHCSAFSNELSLFSLIFDFFVQISSILVGATRL